ncbi:unnamed protein product [Menidia menidia]|uniref:Nucleolar protein 6 n=1 Tax=Menidia menidia TaxID=238744 RepID=A0A8S4B397_9TELE|nr:unnamed protein product [Menidia menidia]
MKKKQRTAVEPVEMLPSPSSHDEEDKNEASVKAKRSKQMEPGQEEVVYHPVKLSRNDLYRPPTAEELSQLKEAESLFHCSLLKMQMDELLKEVALGERKKQEIESYIQTITKLLQTVPDSPEVEVNDVTWLSGAVKVPFLFVPKTTKGKFHMAPPASIDLIGSFPLGTCTKPHVMVDLAVTIPADVLHPKDAINQRYARKRALYLAGLAQHLKSSSEVGTMRYSCLHGNRLRPVLLLNPPGKGPPTFSVCVHVCPPPGFFKPGRFHPQRNNIRTEWYTGLQSSQSGGSEPPTPHYNSSVLGDLLPRAHLQFLSAVSTQCPAFTDGVALLKVWLHQRNLDRGTGCFNGFLASMLLAYLLITHRISNTMTAYQLLRNGLNFLDLTVNGISLSKEPDSTAPSLAEFHDAFQLQHEASVSMEFWDNPTIDGFHCLLMTSKPMIRTSDHVFQLCDLVKLQASCKKQNLLAELMDHSGNYVQTALPFILSLLEQGLGQRIHLLTHSLSPDPEVWSVESEAPKYKAQPPLSFGVLLRPELASSVLERGPPADSPKAAEFRQLWGPRSELRRFQDGAITEAVLWEGKSMCQKRLVPKQIVTHLLQLHADIPESCVRYVGAMVDDVIKTGSEVPSTGEEESLVVVQSYDDLSRKLWRLENLPLAITAVQGAHPALRYTQVFPPQPLKLDYSFFEREKVFKALVPREGKPCPAYITPITVICHMEGSGKWPNDRVAIRHIRAAFHIRLAELLKKQHNYTSRATPAHVDVWKDGLVFRIQVAYHREPLVLRESVNAEGMLVVKDNEEAQLLEMATIHKPLLTSTLHGLQQQHPCFGAVCRLAKRWLAAQLLSDDITEDTADLLVASLFLHPAPFSAPCSPQVGFLPADYTEIKNSFMASRESLPVMFIATPKDKNLSMWTKRAPNVQMLQRAMTVAAESLKVLEHQLTDSSQTQDVRVIMRPPLDAYDVLIHLNPKQVPLLGQAVDPPAVTFSRGALTDGAAQSGGALPVIDYNPVSLFLTELREAFGDLALFFCDPYGGMVISVLWKPKAFAPAAFKTSHMCARTVKVTGAEANTVPNVEAILEDFRVMGKGLVKSVEAKTEKWSF